MASNRRQLLLLVVLLVALGGVVTWQLASSGPPSPVVPAAVSVARRQSGPTRNGEVPQVKLQELHAKRPEPGEGERNPFRFQPKAPPPPPPGSKDANGRGPAETAASPVPAGPPPPPPITMKFIGVVQAPDKTGKLAVLTDGRGVYYGREGDVIEGRYRILHIGVESIDLAYLDGRGRRTIPLTGS